MLKTFQKLVPISIVLFCSLYGFSQSPDIDYETCPVVDYINYFDTTSASYIPTPTEIQLGQARVLMKDPARCTFVDGIDMYIPTNRPGWAIALAHTHRIMTNFMGADVFNINYLHGACFQESTYKNGSYGETWPPQADHNVASDLVLQCGFAVSHGDGYFHTDANGRIFVSDMYGTRFPTNGASANLTATFEQNIHLAMFWINAFYRVNQYGRELKMKSFFMEAADPLASTKVTAGSYVSGQLLTDVISIMETNRAAALNAPDLLQYITNGAANNYATSVSGYTEALSTPSDIVKPAFESSQHSWYDQQIEWQDVADYLDKMQLVYLEADIPTIKVHVKTVFDNINGGNSVSFRYEFSPVIDAITGSMPYYEPEIHGTQQAIYQCNYDCSLPYPTISYDTPLEFCAGLSVELTSIVGDYTYQWYKDNELIPGADQINYFASESGIYSVVITNSDGCSLETNRKVEVRVIECSSCAMTVDATPQNVTCSGYGDGSIDIMANGVSGPFSYQINTDTPQNGSTFNNLIEGNYFIEVTQLSDPTCKGFASAAIDAETVVTNTISLDSTRIDCESFDLSAEVIDLPPSQCTYKFIRESSNEWGSWPYTSLTVSLKDGDNELYNTRALESVSTLAAQRPFEIDVSVPNGAALSIEVTNASSSGTTHGDIWTYKIVAPDGEVIASAISPGTYPSGKTVIQTPVTAICKFDRPEFSYEWTPLNVLSNLTDTTSTASIDARTLVKITATNLADPTCPLIDSLYLDMCNATGCISATRASISSAGDVTEICDGGSIMLSVDTDQSGYNLQWKLDGTDISGANSSSYSATQAGTYSVVITDPVDPSCSYESIGSEQFSLNSSSGVTPSITIETAQTDICGGESVDITISTQTHEGTTPSYEWFVNDNSETTGASLNLSTLANGDRVHLELTSSESCASTLNATSNELVFTVNEAALPTIEINSSAEEICTGDQVDFSINSQSNQGNSPIYEWLINGNPNSNGETLSLSNLQDGDQISLQLTSSETCISANEIESSAITISVLSSVSPSVIATTPTNNCENESVHFEVSGGNGLGNNPTYDWYINGVIASLTSTASINLSNLEDSDEVTVVASNLSSCATSATIASDPITVTIIEPVTPLVVIEADQLSICSGELISFSIQSLANEGANPSYQWLLNDNPISGADGISYSASSLSNNDEIKLQMNVEETCVTTQEVESAPLQVSTSSPVSPSVEINATTTTICSGESIDFTISSITNEGNSPAYNWTVNGESKGTLASFTSNELTNGSSVGLTITSSESCVSNAEASASEVLISVISSNDPGLTLTSSESLVCEGDEVSFEANSALTSGVTYEWYVNGILNPTSGNELITAINQNNTIVRVDVEASSSCGIVSGSEEITVNMENLEIPSFTNSSVEICSIDGPASLSISGITSANIQWIKDNSPITNATNNTHSATESGSYSVIITGEHCSAEIYAGTEVSIIPSPEVYAGPDMSIGKGESVTVLAQVSNASHMLWTPDTYLDEATAEQPTISIPEEAPDGSTLYTLTASNGSCVTTSSFTLTIYDEFQVYSSYSPNGDGKNDYWLLQGLEPYENATVKIFNRWGVVVFESLGYDNPWDGTYNGSPLPNGTYYYVINFNDLDANTSPLTGPVTIVR